MPCPDWQGLVPARPTCTSWAMPYWPIGLFSFFFFLNVKYGLRVRMISWMWNVGHIQIFRFHLSKNWIGPYRTLVLTLYHMHYLLAQKNRWCNPPSLLAHWLSSFLLEGCHLHNLLVTRIDIYSQLRYHMHNSEDTVRDKHSLQIKQ